MGCRHKERLRQLGQAALIAVDTNVILRFLTHTPDAQFKSAKTLFERGDLFISSPVGFEVFLPLQAWCWRFLMKMP